MNSTPLMLGLLIVSASPLAAASDWPHWKGPDRNNISRETEWNSTGQSAVAARSSKTQSAPRVNGVVFAPADQMFHQHFNASAQPARYFPVAFGSLRYPLTESKRRLFAGGDVSVKAGGDQIEWADQNPEVHRMFLDALARNGVESKMGNLIDETQYQAAE